jgi:hypothetical protein
MAPSTLAWTTPYEDRPDAAVRFSVNAGGAAVTLLPEVRFAIYGMTRA